jgi:UDP-glucose 4-epimerase
VHEVVAAVGRATGRKVPTVLSARRGGDVAETVADPTNANRLLGWKAAHTLDALCRDAWRHRAVVAGITIDADTGSG